LKKARIVEEVSRCCEVTHREAQELVELVLGSISRALSRREEVIIRRFGRFQVRDRRSRIARNPKTGETINVPPKSVVRFTAAKNVTEGPASRTATSAH
jgi:integration host factor subunit beta